MDRQGERREPEGFRCRKGLCFQYRVCGSLQPLLLSKIKFIFILSTELSFNGSRGDSPQNRFPMESVLSGPVCHMSPDKPFLPAVSLYLCGDKQPSLDRKRKFHSLFSCCWALTAELYLLPGAGLAGVSWSDSQQEADGRDEGFVPRFPVRCRYDPPSHGLVTFGSVPLISSLFMQ